MLIENLNPTILTQISLTSLILERGRRKPPFNVFKWWGRRYLALTRALLASLVVDKKELIIKALKGEYDNIVPYAKNKLIYDPFCGGGTIAIEAARMGFDVICRDINLAAIYTAEVTYTICSEKCFKLCEALTATLKKTFDECLNYWCFNEWCFLHVFCARKEDIIRVPIWLATKHSNGKKYFIIINERGLIEQVSFDGIKNLKPTYPYLEINPEKYSLPLIAKNTYAYAAELYTIKNGKVIRKFVCFINCEDELSLKAKSALRKMIESARKTLESYLNEYTMIPPLRETKRLYRKDLTCFEDLFTPRQLLTFIKFLKNAFTHNVLIEAALTIANIMRTCSLLAFYYQPYNKVNPGLVVKSYWIPRNPVELNPLAHTYGKYGVKSIGRGTIATTIKELILACRHRLKSYGKVEFEHGNSLYCRPPRDIYAIVTDPPYIGKQSYRDVSLIHLYALKLADLIDKVQVPEDIDTFNIRNYIAFMEKFVKALISVRPGTYLIMMMGMPEHKYLSHLIEIINIFTKHGFGLRNLYWTIGEAPGVLGRSYTCGTLVLVFRKNVENNISKLEEWLNDLNRYKEALRHAMSSSSIHKVLRSMNLDYEFKLYEELLEMTLKELT